jgi:hypothetical protein
MLLAFCVVSIGSASSIAANEPKQGPSTSSKDRIVSALRTTSEALRSGSIEPSEQAAFAELLDAAEALRRDESVPQRERDRLRGMARIRLEAGANALRRAQARPDAEKISRQLPAGQGGAAGTSPRSPDVAEAEKLIETITGAIRPETWSSQGGLGTIRYWSLGNALIITNSADVHERVGGLGGALRPSRRAAP